MGFNKAREEKKWRRWKDAEEKQLRRLGVDEDVIQRLRNADWDDFKAERRFREHHADTDTYLDWQAAKEAPPDIRNAQDLLDEIESAELHRVLLTVDKLTLQLVLWRIEGYRSAEIAGMSGLSVQAVNGRIWRLKQKIKKVP